MDESRSMQTAYREAFRASGLDLDRGDAANIATMDIYSCFPIAIEQGCRCLGIDVSTVDVARISATGGLAYHGGPGSNYSSHALCAVIEKLRTEQYRGTLGMVAANGGWLTEHSVAIYSTAPPASPFHRRPYPEYEVSYGLPITAFALGPAGLGDPPPPPPPRPHKIPSSPACPPA